jgi:hypothetical protein
MDPERKKRSAEVPRKHHETLARRAERARVARELNETMRRKEKPKLLSPEERIRKAAYAIVTKRRKVGR